MRNVVALIGVNETVTDFVRLGDTVPVACLLVAKGVGLTEPDAETMLLLTPDCVLLTSADADIDDETFTVDVGTRETLFNTVGEGVGTSVVDGTSLCRIDTDTVGVPVVTDGVLLPLCET